MKKSKLFIFGVALLTIVMISCHKGRNRLINSWKITNVEAKIGLSPEEKNTILTNGTLTFTEDGHVTGYLLHEINDGSFVLSEGGKKLVIKDENGTPYVCDSEISEDKLTLDTKEMKLTLTKI